MTATAGAAVAKPISLVLRLFLLSLLFISIRFTYITIIQTKSCQLGHFCFLTTGAATSSAAVTAVKSSKPHHSDLAVKYYSNIFRDLIADGYLSINSKSLCLDSPAGDDVVALKKMRVWDSVGIYKKQAKPFVISGESISQPFGNSTFDFVYAGVGVLDNSGKVTAFAGEVARTLKPNGVFVVHTMSKDTYSFNSFIDLFCCFTFVRSREIKNLGTLQYVREIVMRKERNVCVCEKEFEEKKWTNGECFVPVYKRELFKKVEDLILEEPLKPWITLKKNIRNIKYLSSVVDINFKRSYVYVDVGARSYGSSIGSWFKKGYPKQNKSFEIYAIEADRTFHEEYRSKKGVTLLPYAAWVRNESLVFEVNRDPGSRRYFMRRRGGMGRIQPVQSSGNSVNYVDRIQGFDFANWLKSRVSEKDYVVMKMDVEGTEFELIPRLFETGAICLIDEIFLECHYNRWQKCCPGVRSLKYEKTYAQCLELFVSLRQSGVLVHQWW